MTIDNEFLGNLVQNVTHQQLLTPTEDTFIAPEVSFKSDSLQIQFKSDLVKLKKPNPAELLQYHFYGDQPTMPPIQKSINNELEVYVADSSDKQFKIWRKFLDEMDDYGKSSQNNFAEIIVINNLDKRTFRGAFIAEMKEASFPEIVQKKEMTSFLDDEEYEISEAVVCHGYMIRFRFMNFEVNRCI